MLQLTRLLCETAQMPTPEGIWRSFSATLDAMPFTNLFYCSGVPTDGPGGVQAKVSHGYMMGTMIADGIAEALLADPDAFADDFIAEHCKRDLRPLFWSTEPQNIATGPRQRGAEFAMDCGCHSGLTIPLHDADGTTFGNLSFFYGGSVQELADLTREHIVDLQAGALYAHTMLVARKDADAGTSLDSEVELALSPRERDCLLGLACGDRTMQIADRLTLSDATVHEYVSNAKRKLRARTRAEAVARAVLLGLITP